MEDKVFVRSDLRAPLPARAPARALALPAALALATAGCAATLALARAAGGLAALPLRVDDAVGLLVTVCGAAFAAWYALTGLAATVGLVLGRGMGVARWGAPLARRLVLGVGIGLAVVTPAQADVPDNISWVAVVTDTPAAPVPTPTAPAAPDPGGAQPAAAASAPLQGGQHYLVEPGDCLWTIAAAELGDGVQDREVALRVRSWIRANPQLRDPDLIHPGERLAVPAVEP